MWSFATGFTFIATPYLIYAANHDICEPELTTEAEKEITYKGWCDDGQIDPNASLFWASEGGIIKNIMNTAVNVTPANMFIFLAVWYVFTITTYGTNVPAGLFLPGMIVGCALGKTIYNAVDFAGLIFLTENDPQKAAHEKESIIRCYVILACAAFMAGYTRMTYSLAVILMETSQDIEIFTPMIVTIAIANQMGYFFTRSLYERATRTKQMPLIKDSIPPPCEAIIATQLMNRDVVTIKNVDTVQNLLAACKTSHHAFPVLNSRGNVVGLMPKNYILTLLEARAFYRMDGMVDEIENYAIQDERNSSVSNRRTT